MPPGVTAAAAADIKRFREYLLHWFQKHQRKLPWRGETDPYCILVSEIMLQQTRVAVVERRYKEFVAQFPTAEKLARARETTVLTAWSGLGYYRRARALHRAAREVVRLQSFPRTMDALMELPGVGRYTAAAVASIAFGEPVAVVDGNVKRVLERLAAMMHVPEEAYWKIAANLLDHDRPGDFNQAMMELGALICLPAQPMCQSCPVATMCASRGPLAKGPQQPRQKATLYYSLVRRNGSVLLRQRSRTSSLMPGMWELPESNASSTRGKTPLFKLRHSITTTDYTVFVHETMSSAAFDGQWSVERWVSLRSVRLLPLTGLARKIVEKLDHA